MNTDAELLRRYVHDRSEPAFAELVQRHLNLVYFAALRQVGGDAHRAQDVAQSVFTDLARKAATLADRATLTGWLHTSTRFAAANVRRADFVRHRHEQEATTMNALLSDADPAAEWERLRPMIDDAIHELEDCDREAVLLRFFDNRPFAEIGATLRLSEDAARMRVDRALDKLRAALTRRGVESTSAALAVVFANQLGATPPMGLAGAITSSALAGAAAGTGFLMSTATVIISAVALTAVGSTFYQRNHAQRAKTELAALTLERDNLRAQLRVEDQRAKQSAQDFAALRSEFESLKAKQPTALPTSAVVPQAVASMPAPRSKASLIQANLRQIAASIDRFNLENGRPPASLGELVGEGKFIKRLVAVDGETYSGVSLLPGGILTVTTPSGEVVTHERPKLDPVQTARAAALRHVGELAQKVGPARTKAIGAYRAANNGQRPPSEEALLPYFPGEQERADFVEFLEAQKAARRK